MFSVQCTSLEQTVLGHGQVGDRGCVLSLPTLLALSPSPGAVGSQGAHGARLHPEVPMPLSWGWQQGGMLGAVLPGSVMLLQAATSPCIAPSWQGEAAAHVPPLTGLGTAAGSR